MDIIGLSKALWSYIIVSSNKEDIDKELINRAVLILNKLFSQIELEHDFPLGIFERIGQVNCEIMLRMNVSVAESINVPQQLKLVHSEKKWKALQVEASQMFYDIRKASKKCKEFIEVGGTVDHYAMDYKSKTSEKYLLINSPLDFYGDANRPGAFTSLRARHLQRMGKNYETLDLDDWAKDKEFQKQRRLQKKKAKEEQKAKEAKEETEQTEQTEENEEDEEDEEVMFTLANLDRKTPYLEKMFNTLKEE